MMKFFWNFELLTISHYRKDVAKSLAGSYKSKLESQWDNLYEIMLKVIEDNQLDDSYIAALNNRIALNMLGVGLNCIQDDNSIYEKYQRVKKALSHKRRNQALKQLSLRYMPIHWKLFYFSAKHKFALMLFILLISINWLRGKV